MSDQRDEVAREAAEKIFAGYHNTITSGIIADALDKYAEGLKEIIERIMTQHWDMRCCTCWVCVEGRRLGCRPRENYMHDKTKGQVLVDLGASGNDVERI